MRNPTEVKRGLTWSAELNQWTTHRILGARVHTVDALLRKLYSGRKLRAALALNYQWDWIIQSFVEENKV